jgi:hypothetical protein
MFLPDPAVATLAISVAKAVDVVGIGAVLAVYEDYSQPKQRNHNA